MGSAASNLRKNEKLYKNTRPLWLRSFAPIKEMQDEFEEHVKEVLNSCHDFDKMSLKDKHECRKKAGELMVRHRTIESLCNELVYCLNPEKDGKQRMEKWPSDRETTKSEVVENGIKILALMTDPESGFDVCKAVVQQDNFVETLTSALESKRAPEDMKVEYNQEIVFREGLTVIHNIAVYEAELDDAYSSGATQGRTRYGGRFIGLLQRLATKEESKDIKLLATVALSCIDKPGTPNIKEDMVQFICLYLSWALEEPDHRCHGCSVTAMERGIRHILKVGGRLAPEAAKEGAKPKSRECDMRQFLVKCGAVQILSKGAKSDIEHERAACIESLWYLCSEENCKRDMAEDSDLVKLLWNLKDDNSKTNTCQTQARFICKSIEGHAKKHPKQRSSGAEEETDAEANAPPGHVMLSYQTNDREIVAKIKKGLESRGIKTWMDVDHMHDQESIFRSMESAVKNCRVFIMAMSRGYRDSKNCEKEAVYACNMGKPILPLKLHRDYTADDWLAFILGASYYYDFSEESNFEGTFQQLLSSVRRYFPEGKTSKKNSGNQATATTSAMGNQTEESKVTETGASSSENRNKTEVDGAKASPRKPDEKKRGASTTPRPKGVSPRQIVYVAPYCRLHPNTACGSTTDAYSHCCCGYTDQKKEVRDWAKKYRIDGPTIKSLSKKDLQTLLRLKKEAPEFFYRRVWNDLKLTKFSEIERFEQALAHWEKKDDDKNDED